MGKMKYKPVYERHVSQYTTDHFTCNNCPAKLFHCNNPDWIKKGVGNINSAKIIIASTYISRNEKTFDSFIDIINEEYKHRYSTDLLESVYITPVVKCYTDSCTYPINNILLEKCAIKTKSEFANHKVHQTIIYIGDAEEIDMIMPQHLVKVKVHCPYTVFEDLGRKEQFLNELFKIL